MLVVLPHVLPAHANMLRAEPGPNSELDSSPTRIRVEFSEPLEEQGSRIVILDPQGDEMETGEPRIDPDDRRIMTVTLPDELPTGTYTVVWRSLSSVDGHTVRGSFLFAVGEPLGRGAQPAEEQALFESWHEPAARWLVLLGYSAMIGAIMVSSVVLRPGYRSSGALEAIAGRLERRRWGVIAAGAVLFAAGSVLHLVSQTRVTGARAISVLGGTSWGSAWVWRMGAWIVLMVCFAVELARHRRGAGEPEDGERAELEPIAYFAAIGVLVAVTATSHVGAGTAVRTAAVLAYLLHLVASTIWSGVLICVSLMIPVAVRGLPREHLTRVLPPLASRIWILALVCVTTVTITGLYLAWIQVTVHDAMNTPYGIALAIKVLLVAPMVLLGALNYLWVRAGLARRPDLARWFVRFGRTEAVLAVLVLMAVGAVASMEPGRMIMERRGRLGAGSLVMSEEAERLTLTLTVEPAYVGTNRLALEITDARGNAVNATDVSLVVYDHPRHYIHFEERAAPVADGRYVVDRAALSVEGIWRVDTVVRRPDAFDARATFQFHIAQPGEGVGAEPVLEPVSAWLLLSVQVIVIALLFVGVVAVVRAQRQFADAREPVDTHRG